jgi:hypothetical protein
MCADQQSGQWFIKAIDKCRLESGARVKDTDGRNLPKPVKVAEDQVQSRPKSGRAPEMD